MSARELPAICYNCGADVEDTPRFGTEATCDACCRKSGFRSYYERMPTDDSYDGPDDGEAWSGGFAENH